MSTRARIVEQLGACPDFVSGRALAEGLGISRAAVWKHIESLKADGYRIESARARGYRLLECPDRVSQSELAACLDTAWLGRRVIWHAATGSTNADAAAAARDGAVEGTIVVAEEQSAGRGRLGRTWVSAAGVNLYLSVVLRPHILPAEAPQLSLVAGLGVAAALEREGLDPRIKWPNDVLLDGRKVCGILTEIEAEADRVSFVVVGIGVNLNSTLEHFPEELHAKATSVVMASGRRVDRARFAARLLGELEKRYQRFQGGGFAALAAEWESRSDMLGREICVRAAGEEIGGICMGIDSDGALLLKEEGGETPRRVLAGDVSVIGGYQAK